MSLRRSTALAILLLGAFSLSFLGATLGDPGSGSDAPDSISNATTLTAPGRYQGSLVPQGDSDWYKALGADLDILDVPACFEARASGGDALADVEVTFDEDRSPAVVDELNPDSDVSLGMATPSFERAYTGLYPVVDDQSYGEYNLSVSVLDVDSLNGDGASGLDAPALGASGDPIEMPGTCFGGHLDLNDTSDAFSFQAEEHERIDFTFTVAVEEDVQAFFVSPGGTEYGPYASTDATGVHTIAVDDPGEWTVGFEGTVDQTASYLSAVSLVDDPEEEEGNGCNPYCME